jgi:PAS domain S-box-containing protein
MKRGADQEPGLKAAMPGGQAAARSFSIVRRLSFSIAVIATAVSVLASVLVSLYEVVGTRADFEARANSSIKYLETILDIPMWNLDSSTIRFIGDAFFRDPAVASLEISGRDGEIYYSDSRPLSRDLSKSADIAHLGRKIGKVELSMTYRFAARQVVSYIAKIAMILALVVVAIFLVGGSIIRVFLRNPLAYLGRMISSYPAEGYSERAHDIPYLEFKPFVELLELLSGRIRVQLGELRASESKFKTIFNSSPAAMVITDLESTEILDVNTSLELLLGYKREEFIGSDSGRLGLYRDPADREAVYKAVRAGIAVEDREIDFVSKDSRVIPARFSARLIDIDGQVRMLSLLVDITERRLTEKRLGDSLEEKSALLRELYHRTKNNMQVICSMLSMKASQIDDERVKEVLEDVSSHIYSMALVHEKLYQSQSLSSIGLREYLDDLIALLAKSPTPKRIEYALDLDEVSVSIETAIPLGLIVTELITNSMRHAFQGKPGGRIAVVLRQAEGRRTIEVSDDGVGFPEGFDWRSSGSMGLQTVITLGSQLNGSVDFRSGGGLSCVVAF